MTLFGEDDEMRYMRLKDLEARQPMEVRRYVLPICHHVFMLLVVLFQYADENDFQGYNFFRAIEKMDEIAEDDIETQKRKKVRSLRPFGFF